jgi:hypothetical protein
VDNVSIGQAEVGKDLIPVADIGVGKEEFVKLVPTIKSFTSGA